MNEDWDDMTAAEPLAGEELDRLMARYARVRLDPGQAQVRRARAAVMEDAWRHRIDPAGTIAASGRRWPARRAPFTGWSVRRVGLSMSAAVLAGLLVGTSAFAASRAGGPLYETRVALETLTLPAQGPTRVDAQLARAQTRLAEAVDAAGRHDDPATTAALDAYDDTINELESMDGAPAARALEAVRFQRAILVGIVAGAPEGAVDGLARAIANSDRVIEALATPGPAAGAGNPGGNGHGNPGAKPTDKPAEATAKPDKTRAPARTQPPAASEKPGRTPPPRKTPSPGKPDDGGRQPAPSNRP